MRHTYWAFTALLTLSACSASSNPQLHLYTNEPTLSTQHFAQFSATYSDQSLPAKVSLYGTQLLWETSDPTVATVDSYGKVFAVAAGTVTISGRYQGLLAPLEVTVIQSPLRLTIAPDNPSLLWYQFSEVHFTVTQSKAGEPLHLGTDSDADMGPAPDMLPALEPVWTSSAPWIATIGADSGVARPVDLGTTIISATVGDLVAQTTLTVVLPPQ